MKLCPQCDFIYEDDQGFCDMDGKQLVYEPTLQTSSQSATTEESLQLVPLSNSSQPPGFKAAPGIFGIRGNRGLAIAAGLLLAIMLVVAVWISSRLFSGGTASSSNTESQNPKLATSYPAPEVKNVAVPAAKPEASANSKQPGDSGTPVSQSSASPIKPLPGVKPLPRLEPLPRLKPIPRLQEQKRSAVSSPKPPGPNASGNNNTKKESGVSSFLKKTGRILKKPFKF